MIWANDRTLPGVLFPALPFVFCLILCGSCDLSDSAALWKRVIVSFPPVTKIIVRLNSLMPKAGKKLSILSSWTLSAW